MSRRITLLVVAVVFFPCFSIAQVLQPPTTVPAGLGVNIHFTEPAKGEMEQLAAGGFKFIRMDFRWHTTEKKNGVYDFSEYDVLLNSLKPHGIRALFILDYVNELYDDNRSPDTDEGRRGFANWAAAAVKHFKGRGILWEMYNEPNIHPFWRPKPNTDDYIKLALATGNAIRAAAPDEIYIGPACSTMDFKFLEACFQGGLLEYFKAVSVHPYRPADPETVAADYRQLRILIEKYKPKNANIPIYSGEWGYSSVWSKLDEAKQGQLLPRQWLTNISNGVPLSIWYDWHDDGKDPKEPEHHFGTVHNDYSPKPAYLAAKKLTTELRGFTFNKRLMLGKDDDYILLFEKAGAVKLAAWTRSEAHDIDVAGIPIKLSGEVQYVAGAGEPFKKLAAWKREPMELFVEAPADVNGRHITRGEEFIDLDIASEVSPTIKQRSTIVVTNPLRLSVQPTINRGVLAAIENPSGQPFKGTILLNKASRPITINDERQMTIPLGSADNVVVTLRDEKGQPIITSPKLKFTRLAMTPEKYVVKAEGDKAVNATQTLAAGKVGELKVTYAFEPGWKYACVHPKDLLKVEGKPSSVAFWLTGDGTGNHMRMRYMDSTGQTFQVDGPRMSGKDRRFVSFDFTTTKGTHWGGADDGEIHWPIKLETLLLIDNADRGKTGGTVTIDSATLIYDE